MNPKTNMLKTWIAAAVFAAATGLPAGRAVAMPPAPLPGEIWVYPTGVFPDDFYALWLAVNGVPYAAGDLPYPYHAVPDPDPGSRPVFVGKARDGQNWTIVLKAHRLDGDYREGAFTAFNLGLAAGTQLIKKDPVPPVMYMLTTDEDRFSTGFGEVLVQRPVEIVGDLTPEGEECFFGYTPNFDPAASPDTNPAFEAKWLPDDYPTGAEYDPELGYGVWSTKSVVYGGAAAFHIYPVNVDLTVRNCLLYGQYGYGISIHYPPSRTLFSNVEIRHTYHLHYLTGKTINMCTWGINIAGRLGGGGKHLIEGCMIDQSPTWQEYYFDANPAGYGYHIGETRASQAVYVYILSKQSADDFVHIEDSMFTNCAAACVVYNSSNVDFHIADCVIDGGYFPYTPTKDSAYADWLGTCIRVFQPWVEGSDARPVIEIRENRLVARGWRAWGARLDGCGNGEVTLEDNKITCASASPVGYAGGVLLRPSAGIGCNENTIAHNKIEGTGGWAISVDAFDTPCEWNSFIDNDLAGFSPTEAGAVFFGPLANDNYFSGSVGAGIVDLGTGNVVEQSP
jgi:hypothetical protein